MKLHYIVRSVLLSANSSAVTMEPAVWYRESDTEMIEDDEGHMVPADVALVNEQPRAGDDVMGEGGPKTELRFEGVTDFVPGDYVTLDVRRTLP